MTFDEVMTILIAGCVGILIGKTAQVFWTAIINLFS